MANRAITTMPIWGLSVLAVGSIGAPLHGIGKTDISAHTVSLDMPTADILPVMHYAPLNPQQPKLAASRNKRAVQAFQAKPKMDQGFGIASTTSVGSSAIHPGTPSPALAIKREAAPIVSASKVGAFKKLEVTLGTALSSLPKAVPNRVGPPMPPGSNQAIYGTSANNAYKVYFPQIEAPAAGSNIGQLENYSEAQEQDNRVLKKNGSYLIYESPSDIAIGQKIEASSNADGVVDADALARAITKLGKGVVEEKLTEPPLQKKPLDFGKSLFKVSNLPENAPTTTAGGADVEQ